MIERLEVTLKNIEHGEPCSPTKCPIALALYEAGAETVDAGEDGINFFEAGIYRSVESSPELQQYIANFDSGKKVEPIAVIFNIKNRKARIETDVLAH